jgi:hypothetical protein
VRGEGFGHAMGRLVLVLAALLAGVVPAGAAENTSPVLRDAWFTRTESVPGQRYGRSQPENIWERTAVFEKGKDTKAILLIVLKDLNPHTISGVLTGPEGKPRPFKYSVTTLQGGQVQWRATSRAWDVGNLYTGKHTVELAIDDVPAGSYTFLVK